MQMRATKKLICNYFNSFQLGERWQPCYIGNSKSNEYTLSPKNAMLGEMQRTSLSSAGKRSMLMDSHVELA